MASASRTDQIRLTEVGSGLRVLTERMPDVRSATIGFWVAAGSRDEEPEVAGVSHFLEHLLFKGTDTRTAKEIADAVDAVGGEMNAFTTKEYTAFYTRLVDLDVELGLDILSDIMWSPAFRPDEIEAERQVILEEILMHEDDPSDLVHDVLHEAMFPEHALGRQVLGDAQTISAMSRDQIHGYWASCYRPANIVVAAAGNLDHDAIVEGIDRRFAGATGGRVPDRSAPVAPPWPVLVASRPTEQAHLAVGLGAPSAHDPHRFAFSVLNQVLGGGMSSRLFQEIREKRGLVYSVYSYRCGYADTGALAVYAGTAPSRAHDVLALVHEELDRLGESGITAQELDAAKGHLRGSLALGLEDSGSRMSRLGRSQLVHGEVLPIDEVVARTDAVTLDDVRRVIDCVLASERVLGVVGPFEDTDFEKRVA